MCGACDDAGHHQLERSQSQTKQRDIQELEIKARNSDKHMSVTRNSAASHTSHTASAEINRNLASRSSSFHQRSLTSPIPCTTRRIIFPSLYDGSKQQHQQPSFYKHDHDIAGQPVTASDTERGLPHMRANSLDGILIPLPIISRGSVDGGSCIRPGDDAKQVGWSPPQPREPPPLNNVIPKPIAQDRPPPQSRCAAQDPPLSSSLAAATAPLNVPLPPRSRSIILGDVLRHRTYYPAATIPTPVDKNNNNRKKSSPDAKTSKPITSILRRRLPVVPPTPPPSSSTSSSTAAAISRRASAPNIATSSLPKASTPRHQLSKSLSIPPPRLSLTVPTLASPASIISLHAHHDSHHNSCSACDHSHPHDGNGSTSIGESECDLVRITDAPKVLPRSEQCTLRKIQSDTIVANMEEDARSRRESGLTNSTASATATPCHEKSKNGKSSGGRCSSVSRHVSLESLGTSKRVSFDPHIIVYEFGIADYEKRGGDKWWGEEELAQFKQEAIQRIRLRSTKVIPTGTGRAFAVPTKKGEGGGGKAATAAISFNHPALRCCEDELFESECKKTSSLSKESLLNSCLTQEIRNILVVDPHEIFLALFTKSLRFMFPHASVATARSAEEALTRIQAAQCAFPQSDGGSMHGFDIIIIEEKLLSVPHLSTSSGSHNKSSSMRHSVSTQPAGDDSIQRRCSISSGSGLIRHLIESELHCQASSNNRLDECTGDKRSRFSLFVGVSTHLSDNREKLEKAGADCIWGKPPPEMNNSLRNDLLKTLMKKRQKQADFDMFEA